MVLPIPSIISSEDILIDKINRCFQADEFGKSGKL